MQKLQFGSVLKIYELNGLVHFQLKLTMFVSYANAHHFSLALSATRWDGAPSFRIKASDRSVCH